MEDRLMTPEFRVAFAKVHKPEAYSPGDPEKYSLVALFDADKDLKDMKNLARVAVEEKWPDKNKRPKNLKTPFRKGEEKPDLDGYEGKIFVAMSTKMKPWIVDKKCVKIINEDEFYSGCYARATVMCYAYNFKGNCGVAFGLNNIQKIADGDHFGGGVKAENDFDDSFDTGGDDPFNDTTDTAVKAEEIQESQDDMFM